MRSIGQEKYPFVMYGGAFNPPHLDHEGIVQVLLEKIANQVIIIPTGERDDKNYGSITPKHREGLVREAFGAYGDQVVVDTHFLHGNTPSTTRNQAEYLRNKYAHDVPQVFGSDVVPNMYSWDPEGYVAKELPKIFISRPGYEIDATLVANYDTVEYKSRGISSTSIRQNLLDVYSQKCPVANLSEMVSRRVLEYITNNHLY